MSDLENTKEEFIDSMKDIIESLRSMGISVDAAIEYSRRDLTEEQRKAIAKRQFEKERDEWNKKWNKRLNDASNAVLGFSKSLMSSPGSFAPLKTVVDVTTKAFGSLVEKVPFFGGALKALGDAAGETAKLMVDTFQQAYSSFEKIAESGVVNTFDQMKDSAMSMGLTFGDTEKVLTKVGKDLALIGGSATTGRKMMDYLGAETEQTRRTMQRLGISASDYSEFLVSYTAQQERYTRGQIKDYKALAEGSEKYIRDLDLLSKLTGVNRKQLQTEQEARLRDTRYRAGIANLGDKARKEIDVFLSLVKQIAPEMEDGFKDAIASGGVLSTEASKSLAVTLAQAGIDIRDISKQFRDGNLTGIDAIEKLANAAGKATDKTQMLASIRGDETMVTKYFVALKELELKKGKLSIEQYEKEKKAIEKAILSTEGQNSALADTKTALYNAGRELELLMTSSEIAVSAMKWFAEGIESLTDTIYEATGGKKPEHIVAKKQEAEYTSRLEELEKEKKARIEKNDQDKNQLKSLQAELDDPKTSLVRKTWLNAQKVYFEGQVADYENDIADMDERRDFLQVQRKKASQRREKAMADAGMKPIPNKPNLPGKQGEKTELEKQLEEVERNKQKELDEQNRAILGSKSKQELYVKEFLKDSNDKIEELQKKIAEAEDEKNEEKKKKLEIEIDSAIKELRKKQEEVKKQKKFTDETERQSNAEKAKLKIVQDASDKKLRLTAADEDNRRRAASTTTNGAPQASGTSSTPTTESSTTPDKPTEANADNKPLKDFIRFANSNSGDETHFNRLDSNVKEAFIAMAKEYHSMTEKKLSVNSSYRTYEEQKKLYDEWKNAGFPKTNSRGRKWVVADPDKEPKSKHMQGKAIDIDSNQLDKLNSLGLASKYNFKTLDNDEMHLYMRDGGVVKAKPGGTKVVAAEAGMNEAFVPLPNGKSIPVEIKNNFMRDYSSSDNSDLISSLENNRSAIERSNSEVVAKLETLATLMSTNTSVMLNVAEVLQSSKRIQSNMLQNSMI